MFSSSNLPFYLSGLCASICCFLSVNVLSLTSSFLYIYIYVYIYVYVYVHSFIHFKSDIPPKTWNSLLICSTVFPLRSAHIWSGCAQQMLLDCTILFLSLSVPSYSQWILSQRSQWYNTQGRIWRTNNMLFKEQWWLYLLLSEHHSRSLCISFFIGSGLSSSLNHLQIDGVSRNFSWEKLSHRTCWLCYDSKLSFGNC